MNLEKRNSPTYLSKYGLSRAPFSTTIEHDMFYPEHSRAQRLDLLLHLSQYSHDILLVIGPEGSGKTTLLNQYLHKTEKTWHVCQIDAHPLIDEEQLILRISHGFNLQVEHFEIENAEHDLHQQLQDLLNKYDSVIIVVDNAQILTKDVLGLLCRLATAKNDQKDQSVRLILFSQAAIRPVMAQLDVTYRTFDLPPFDELATKEMVHHRMSVSGAKDETVFSDTNIHKIHKLSNGNPSKILDIGHRILTESPQLERTTYKGEPQTFAMNKAKKNRLKFLPLTGLVLLSVLLVAILGFQDKINNLFFHTNKTVEPMAESISPQPSPVAPDIAKQEKEKEKEKIIVALKIPELNPKTKKPDGPQKKMAFGSTHQTVADKIAPIPKQTKTAGEPPQTTRNKDQQRIEPKPKPKPKTKAKPVETVGSNNNKPVKTAKGIKTAAWILKQNPQHRSLQLIAGYQYTTLTNYINKHKLPKKKLAYYRSQNKGKDWHSLLYGVYPDYQSAKSAAKKLRKQLGKNKPWIRKIKSIQNDIKNKGKP